MGKKRLYNLEVDEVSLVDKPAIGEQIYVTKRVNDKGEDVSGKTGNTTEVQKVGDGKTTENTNTEAPKTADEVEKRLNAVEGRVEKSEQGLKDLEAALTQSLEIHEVVSASLNELASINLSSLDIVLNLLEADAENDITSPDAAGATPDTAVVEAAKKQKALITNVRECSKAVTQFKEKAGAKISRTRMELLREVAAKLSELIQSVDTKAADGKKGAKKKALADVAKNLESFTGEIGVLKDAADKMQETINSINDRLKSVESTAGASNAIGDEDGNGEDDDTNAEPANKSLFAGIIPKETRDRIQKSSRPARK